MGYRARDFCRTDTAFITDVRLIGRSDLAFGEACRVDDQCDSGRCLGGTCQCDQDVDCPTAQKCFKPVAGRNYCSLASKALNAACTRNDECLSDRCENRVCVCRHDSDCSGGRRRSHTNHRFEPMRNTGPARLEELRWEPLAPTIEPACPTSATTTSHCNSDADCAAGRECYRPIGAANVCRVVGLNLGRACQRDSQCLSGKCESDECVCRHDDDCGQTRIQNPDYREEPLREALD